MKLRMFAIVCSLLAAPWSSAAPAETYPNKPLRLIVPAPAGSPPDIRSRWVAAKLSPALGQPLVVENKPGAGGIIGAAAAAKSAPDGYTLVAVHQGTLAFNPYLYAKPGYDPIRDFAPVTRTSVASFVLAVHPDVKAVSVADLVRLARAQPGKLSFGSAPIGTPPHMAEQLFRRMAGIDVTLVPYQGGNLALNDLVAGRVTYTLDGIGITLPLARAGKLRMLAVTSARRLPFLPDVPTVAESGVPGYAFEFWTGLCAPAGTPKPIIARLNSELVGILKAPESVDWWASQGEILIGDTPEEFAAVIEADYRKWGPIIRTAGIKIE